MARIVGLCVIAGGASPLPLFAQPIEPQLSGYVTLATDARSHGVSQLAGDTAFRLGIDYQRPDGLFVGAELGNVSYPSKRLWDKPRERVLQTFAGYRLDETRWGLTATLGHYLYPDTSIDYDYSALAVVVDFRERYYYSVTYTDDFHSLGGASTDHEIGLAYPLPAEIELSASLGHFNVGGQLSTDYTHFNVGATRLVGRFGLDLRYYETSREVVSYFGTSAADRWVFSVSYAIRPGA